MTVTKTDPSDCGFDPNDCDRLNTNDCDKECDWLYPNDSWLNLKLITVTDFTEMTVIKTVTQVTVTLIQMTVSDLTQWPWLIQ